MVVVYIEVISLIGNLVVISMEEVYADNWLLLISRPNLILTIIRNYKGLDSRLVVVCDSPAVGIHNSAGNQVHNLRSRAQVLNF